MQTQTKDLFFRLWVICVSIFILAAGLQLTLHFYYAERLYPVDLKKVSHDEQATRRARNEAEEESEKLERREEEDDEENKNDTLGANPFVPKLDDLPDVSVPPGSEEAVFAKKFDERNFKVSAFSGEPTGVSVTELTTCKAVIERTLEVLPSNLTASLNEMTLYFNRHEPRGMANSHTLEIRCGGLTDREVAAVLVHELGHITDLGAFRGTSGEASPYRDGTIPVLTDDPSADFYALSWRDEKTQRFDAIQKDFVSGYAMSDPFEDFAESFITYVLHGDDFRMIAKESNVLQKKYDFLKNTVFEGREFTGGKKMVAGKRVWDVTLVEYDLPTFLAGHNALVAKR